MAAVVLEADILVADIAVAVVDTDLEVRNSAVGSLVGNRLAASAGWCCSGYRGCLAWARPGLAGRLLLGAGQGRLLGQWCLSGCGSGRCRGWC